MSKYVKGIRVFLVAITLMTLTLLLTACSEKVVSERQIKHDVENHKLFSALDVDISDFDILKRQTNIDKKTDIVYVALTAENEDYSVSRSYVLTYVLYNDGWILDEFDSYFNEETPDRTTPLHGVSYEELNAYIRSLDYSQYTSFSSSRKKEMQISVSFDEQPDSGDYMDINDHGFCESSFSIVYQFYTFNELIKVPISYDFYNYAWHPRVKTSSISRELVLNENIVGLWGSDYSNFSVPGRLNISSYDENGCFAELFKTYDDRPSVKGKLIFEYSERYDGTLCYPHLSWENDNYYSSSTFIRLDSYEPNTIEVKTGIEGYWGKLE